MAATSIRDTGDADRIKLDWLRAGLTDMHTITTRIETSTRRSSRCSRIWAAP